MTQAIESLAALPRPSRARATPEVALLAKQKLEQIVETGRINASRTVEHVLKSTPDDALVRGDRLTISTAGARIRLHLAEAGWDLHANALGQLCGRVGMPLAFAKELHQEDQLDGKKVIVDNLWRRQLLQTNFRELLFHGPKRHLLRSVSGEARAVLSDKYRRLDSRPLLDAFIAACAKVGAMPYEGVATDLSTSVRAIVPTVLEPVPGEHLVCGLCWQNSDFGTRAYSLSAFMLRLVCLNGMVGANELKQVHLGSRLPDDMAFSEKTYQLDTKTMASATSDVVKGALDEWSIERKLRVVARAHSEEIDWSSAWRRVSRDLNKTEQKTLKDSFEGQDVINLPAGKTTWRLSNALSWMAKTEDGERKLDLERLAGAVLPEAK